MSVDEGEAQGECVHDLCRGLGTALYTPCMSRGRCPRARYHDSWGINFVGDEKEVLTGAHALTGGESKVGGRGISGAR